MTTRFNATLRRLGIAFALTALTAITTVHPSVAQAARVSCTKTAEEIYLHDFSDEQTRVKAGDVLEYDFVIQNNADHTCTETVAFHYSSKNLSITSISGHGKVLKGQGQVAWKNQAIESISTDVDYYYRVVATVRKSAPTGTYTTYATSTPSTAKIPGMTSASKCTQMGDQCASDKDKVTK